MPTTPGRGLPLATVTLLAVATFISYFDRGILSTASPLIQSEFALSKTQLGFLFAAFYWSYAPVQPLAGWLAQRFEVRYVLGAGLALWGLSTTLMGFATSIGMMLLLRVLLGLGESVAYPSNAKFLGQHAAVHERGRANGMIAVGQALGPTAGVMLSGVLMARHGWRAAFLTFGLLSLTWLLPWALVTPAAGAAPGASGDSRPVPYHLLLRERSVWGTSLGHFCGNYAYYFMLTWLPLLLVREFHFSLTQMAVISGGVYGIQAVSAAATGWTCDRLIRRGGSPNRILKTSVIGGLVGVSLAMLVCAGAGPRLSVAAMLLASVCIGMQSAPMNSITQTLGGRRTAGQWMGVQNLVANLAGIVGPPLTGFLVDITTGYFWAFILAAAVTLLGVLAYGVLIGTVQPVDWPAAELAASRAATMRT